jgi:hypothetical protein
MVALVDDVAGAAMGGRPCYKLRAEVLHGG